MDMVQKVYAMWFLCFLFMVPYKFSFFNFYKYHFSFIYYFVHIYFL